MTRFLSAKDCLSLRNPLGSAPPRLWQPSLLVAVFLVLSGRLSPSWADAVVTPDALSGASTSAIDGLIFGLFMGVVLTAAAYLFFIWIVMRDRGQVSLICLLMCLGAYIASTNTLLMDPAGLHTPAARGLLSNYSLIFSCLFSVLFTYYFLELDLNNPMFIKPMIAISILLLFLLLYSIFDQNLAHFALPAIAALTIGLVLAAGISCLLQGISGSFMHIVAFIFFLTGVLAEPLYDLGVIVHLDSVNKLIYAAFSTAALMFAIVIASQFAARQEEKEKALAVSNERFTLATRGANEGLFDWNLTTGEVFFSEQFRRILGQRFENKPESLKKWIRLVAPNDRRVVREAIRRFRRNPEVSIINLEYRATTKPGERRWLHSKAVAVRDAATHKITRLVGSTSDITSRKQSEVALRASETRFRSITEAHPVPVMIVGLNSNTVLYASPGAEELLGLPQDRLLRHSFSDFLAGDDMWREIVEAMRHGHEINLKEIHLRRGSGNILTTALSARRISYQDEDSMVIGLYDLTERKQAEAQIARQQEVLQQTEKMAALGGLLAGVAHELNNPLSVIVGQSTLLMEGSPEPKVVARADKIFKAADRCSRIVKSFLALARRKPPERKPIDINGIINATLDLLGYQIRMENIQVILNLTPDLPEVTGDGDQLTQVVTNLIMNSLQAMQAWQGKKQLTIATVRDGADHVAISVADTGPGVSPELRTKIFEPFFTTKGGTGGTGVGLSLCLNIVASHGGRLTVEDTPGGGATFIASVPTGAAAIQTESATTADTPVALETLSILLVDDEVELAQTLADLLEPEGHHIDIAINGAIAVEKLQKATYDVIISDLRMPVMDGPGLYLALRNEFPAYLKRILYVTGDTLSAHVQEFLKENPVPVIEKPYRLKDVRRAVAALIKESGKHVT
ncbi:MAG: PAS domain S-box protein [Pseudomonadota bacterium]|nr:PAS domain S-box protein [Pseudomonadota bacterium]